MPMETDPVLAEAWRPAEAHPGRLVRWLLMVGFMAVLALEAWLVWQAAGQLF